MLRLILDLWLSKRHDGASQYWPALVMAPHDEHTRLLLWRRIMCVIGGSSIMTSLPPVSFVCARSVQLIEGCVPIGVRLVARGLFAGEGVSGSRVIHHLVTLVILVNSN